jgi:hypothetical protein
VPAVFAQMCGDAVGAALDCEMSGSKRIGMDAATRVAQRRDVIDVDAKTQRASKRRRGYAFRKLTGNGHVLSPLMPRGNAGGFADSAEPTALLENAHGPPGRIVTEDRGDQADEKSSDDQRFDDRRQVNDDGVEGFGRRRQ